MMISGVSNFYVSSLNNGFNLENIKQVQVEAKETPELNQKNAYTYAGGAGTYSNKSKEENLESLLKILKNIQAKKPEWQSDAMALPTGETFQLRHNEINLSVGNIVDIQL